MLEDGPHLIEIEEQFSSRTVTLLLPPNAPAFKSLKEFLYFFREANFHQWAQESWIYPKHILALERFKEVLFFLKEDGTLGELNPYLQFRIHQKTQSLEESLFFRSVPNSTAKLCHLFVDRSKSGYQRNWSAHFKRRWGLHQQVFDGFILEVLEKEYGASALDILKLDTVEKKRLFLSAVARVIYHAPYETYSRYLDPYIPFKSCDEILEAIIAGDGGICSEKAMALYFIASHYQIPSEFILGGEKATGVFPAQELRDLLDQPHYDFKETAHLQKFWEHFAVLCQLSEESPQTLFCDVANSNLPCLLWDEKESKPYLQDGLQKKYLSVCVTTQRLELYYHQIPLAQDIPKDLYFAMEHFMDFIDLTHSIDNELGLVITSDFWVGVLSYSTERERELLVAEYQAELIDSGLISPQDLHYTPCLETSEHPLTQQFRTRYPTIFEKLIQCRPYLLERIHQANAPHSYQVEYVFLKISSFKE